MVTKVACFSPVEGSRLAESFTKSIVCNSFQVFIVSLLAMMGVNLNPLSSAFSSPAEFTMPTHWPRWSMLSNISAGGFTFFGRHADHHVARYVLLGLHELAGYGSEAELRDEIFHHLEPGFGVTTRLPPAAM